MRYTIEYDSYLKRWIVTNNIMWFLIANESKTVCENHLKNLYKIGEQLTLF